MATVSISVLIIGAVTVFALGAIIGMCLTALLNANRYDEIRSEIVEEYLNKIRENEDRRNKE